jgi:hypothetical protein
MQISSVVVYWTRAGDQGIEFWLSKKFLFHAATMMFYIAQRITYQSSVFFKDLLPYIII